MRRGLLSSRDSYHLWSVAAHELGHGFGIAHAVEEASSDDPAAVRQQVMYPSFGLREERRYLGASDYMAVCTAQDC